MEMKIGAFGRPTSMSPGRWRQVGLALPAIAAVVLFVILNRKVLGQPPYYDEIWKLDLIVPGNTVARYFAHDTAIPIGWVYLNKILLFFTPDNFGVARTFSLVWFALAMVLLVRALTSASRIDWNVIAGAAFLATCLPIQSVIRNFNQYPFEIFYSIAMISIALRPSDDTRWRPVGLAFIAVGPFFAIASAFFLPGVLLYMLWNSPNRRAQIEVIIAGAGAATASALIYFLWYRPMVTGPGLPVVEYWQDYVVRGDIRKFLAALARFPSEFRGSLTGSMPPPGWRGAVESFPLVALAAYGFFRLWRDHRRPAILMASGVITALMMSLLLTWPLVFFGESRVNLGWTWILYLSLGFGAAAIVSSLLPAKLVAPVVVIMLVGAIWLGPTWRRYDSDDVPFRDLHKDIANILLQPGKDQVIVQLHYMAHFYPDFAMAVRRADSFGLIREKRNDPRFLAELPEKLAAYPNAKTVWIVAPFHRGPEIWMEIERFALPGYVRTLRYHGLGSMIMKYVRP
jgi:hypothetical protein